MGAHPGFLSLRSRWSHGHRTTDVAGWRFWAGDRTKVNTPGCTAWPAREGSCAAEADAGGEPGPSGQHMSPEHREGRRLAEAATRWALFPVLHPAHTGCGPSSPILRETTSLLCTLMPPHAGDGQHSAACALPSLPHQPFTRSVIAVPPRSALWHLCACSRCERQE